MTECPNELVRDALPEYLHDALDPELAAEVRTHLEECSLCTAELAVMQAIVVTAPRVRIDAAKIVAAIPAYQPAVLQFPVGGAKATSRAVKPSLFHSSRWRMAAGVLVAAIGVSAVSVARRNATSSGATTSAPVVASSTPAQPTNVATTSSSVDDGLSIVGVSGLTDEQLMQLTRDLDRVEATPLDEPESDVPAAMEGGL